MAAATELELQQDIPISGTGQQRLEELIAKRKGKVTSINPKIENINKRTVRAIKDEENFITKTGEFNFSNGKPVKAGIPYHIHYTSTLEEVYMTEYEHKPKKSKIIHPTEIKTNFQYYNTLNKQIPLKIEGERIEPTDQDYLKSYFVRYFAKKANELQLPPFEINVKNFGKSPLYVYVELKWYLAGSEEGVYLRNSREIIKASKTISNIGKILPKMQYYRYDRILDAKELVKDRLGIRETNETTTTTGTTTTGTNAAGGYSAGSGGPPPGFSGGGSGGQY